MLHVVTEIGKPGRNEREKRHFPDLDNQPSSPVCFPRGRRYIPHGRGIEVEFRPHPEHVDPRYSECGPDWKSRIRRIPSPKDINYFTEIWPDSWRSQRPIPWRSYCTREEWAMYPEGKGYDATLRCSFDGKHKATAKSDQELTDAMRLGNKWMVVDKRNGIPMAAPGDKNYQVVEYSPKFHAVGSTLPLVNFGGRNQRKQCDTHIPLEEMPSVPRETYRQKEGRRQVLKEVDDVRKLESWRPATPLAPPQTWTNTHPHPPGHLHDREHSNLSTT